MGNESRCSVSNGRVRGQLGVVTGVVQVRHRSVVEIIIIGALCTAQCSDALSGEKRCFQSVLVFLL